MRTREKIMASYPGTRFAVLGVLLALCLTTCGTPKAQESKSPEESLKNSALAVSVAGDYRESKDPGGGVGFYDPHTNSWTKLSNEGSQTSEIDYYNNKLYFGDKKKDYILGDSLQGYDRNYESVYNEEVWGLDNGGFIATKNIGYTEDKTSYIYKIVTHDGQNTEVHTSNRSIKNPARCANGSVWTVNNESHNSLGQKQKENQGDTKDKNEPTKLIRLYPNFSDDPVTEHTFSLPNRGIDGITCVGNKVVIIRDTYPPGSDPQRSSSEDVTGSALEVFDTDTGQAHEVPISGDHAVRVNRDMWQSKEGHYHAIGREIWWQSGDGTIISTDVETGKNTRHFTLKDYKRSKDQGLFYWSDKYLYNINSTDNKDTLRIYSLHENKLIKEKELPDMKSILSKHQFTYAMVVTNEEELLKL